MSKIIEGAKEAFAVAKGEQPAARIYINGHAYVPAATIEAQAAEIETKTQAVADLARAIFELNTRAEQAESALAKARSIMTRTIEAYYVSSGLLIVDEQDGWGPHKEARLFLGVEADSFRAKPYRAFIKEHGSDSKGE